MLILDEGITTGFPRAFTVDHVDSFDGSVHLKLSSQLRFCCVIVHSSHEQSLEGIALSIGIIVRVPHFQLCLHFLLSPFNFFPSLSLHAFFPGFCPCWRRGISRVLKLSDIWCNATVRLVMVFFMWQLFQGWQVWDGVSGCKKGQKVGRQKLCHLPKSRGALLGLTLVSGLAAAVHKQKLPLWLPLRRCPRQVSTVVRAARANQASPRNPRGLSSRSEPGVNATRIPPPFSLRMCCRNRKKPSHKSGHTAGTAHAQKL